MSNINGNVEAIDLCFVCGKETGAILLDRTLKGRFENRFAVSGLLCSNCERVIKDGGVWLIEVYDNSKNEKQPERTGKLVAVKKEVINIQTNGVCFVEQSTLKKLLGDLYK